MTYSDAIKNGFKLVNKNWQLVLIQFGMMLVNCIGFFVFVGIPLAVAFVMFGLDLTELTEIKNLLGTMRDASEVVSRYLGLIVVLIVSFVVYLFVAASVGLYVFGGSAGIIGMAIKDSANRFNMNMFFSEGKRLFWPMVGFTAIIGAIFIGVAFILGIFGGGIGIIISIAKGYETTLAVVLGIFLSLLLFCIGLALIISSIALTLYGTATIVLKDIGGPKSLKHAISVLCQYRCAFILIHLIFMLYAFFSILFIDQPLSFPYGVLLGFLFCLVLVFQIFLLIKMDAAKPLKVAIQYLYQHPNALWLYCLAFGGYILATFLLVLLGAPFSLIPLIGAIIAIPYQIVSYALQSYLGLVIVAVIFIYYCHTEAEVKLSETPPPQADEGTELVSGNSTPLSDTSQNQASEPESPLPEKEGLR
ncbi:MAG: hypothetical protein Q8K51_09100 [Nitrospirota bacterium]|nr:hypothetical protein [Nitrospirota bacterium]